MVDDFETDIDFLPYVCAGWKRIVIASLMGFAGGAGTAYVCPKWYKAEVSVVPITTHESSDFGEMARAGGRSGLPADWGKCRTGVERIIATFNSSSVVHAVITKFNLVAKYQKRDIEDTREALQSHCVVSVEKKPAIVRLSCEDTSPEVARDLVAYFVEYGNQVVRRIATSSAREERQFLETRLKQARNELDRTSQSLRNFAERNRVISLPEQVKAVVSHMAMLRSDMLTKQAQLSYIKDYSSSSESTSGQLRAQISALKWRLAFLEGSSVPCSSSSTIYVPLTPTINSEIINTEGIFPSVKSIPLLQYQLEQLLRNQKMQETLVTLLAQRYEIARINEASSVPAFQILDSPSIPTQKSRPEKTLFAIVGALLGLGLAYATIIYEAYTTRNNDNCR